jgi:hypothetical protein
MKWTLLVERGIDFAATARNQESRLSFPSFAQRDRDGSYLIVDELGVEKQVPFRFGCRTIRVDTASNILFDTSGLGIDDGVGCLMDEGSMAILRRTTWELLIVSPAGDITECFDMATFSKRMPRFVRWTPRQTFMLVFFNRSRDIDVVEVDRQGRLLWYLSSSVHSVGIVGSVQWLPSDTLLIADPFRHVAVELDRQGHTVWQFGETDNPAGIRARLANPGSALCLADGRRLIADTRNHRILAVDPDGTALPIEIREECLTDPTYADETEHGHYLICDTGNRRVVELDRQGNVVWQYGQTIASRRHLSYPRSVALTGSDRYLVADTAHDRVVEIVGGVVRERACLAEPALFWPRCVRALPGGSLLIADSRNGRILETSPDGGVINQLTHIRIEQELELKDPHDVHLLASGHLLITDSPRGLIVEADWEGNVFRVIGDKGGIDLSDPHSAQALDDHRIIISDTGNHRILIVGRDGTCLQELEAIYGDSCCYRLRFPRYVEVIDGTMVIADTGNNRVLAATAEGRIIWEFSTVPTSPLSNLNQPRWAKLVDRNEVVICDHFHHRLLHVKREESQRVD